MVDIILKVLLLTSGVLFTIVNTYRVMLKVEVPFSNVLFQTVGIVGFITIQWLVKK